MKTLVIKITALEHAITIVSSNLHSIQLAKIAVPMSYVVRLCYLGSGLVVVVV